MRVRQLPLVAVHLGDHERQVERLAAVQPRVAGRLVALVQVGLDDLVAAADALGHVVAGELDVDAARVGAERAVDLEEARPPRRARRRAGGSCGRSAPRTCCRASGRRSTRPGSRGAVTASTSGGSASRTLSAPIRVMNVSRPGSRSGLSRSISASSIVRRGRRAELDADRVADAAEELDVRAVEIPGALADPEQVRRGVVGQPGAAVDPGQRALVVEQQRLVAGVELDPVQLLWRRRRRPS